MTIYGRCLIEYWIFAFRLTGDQNFLLNENTSVVHDEKSSPNCIRTSLNTIYARGIGTNTPFLPPPHLPATDRRQCYSSIKNSTQRDNGTAFYLIRHYGVLGHENVDPLVELPHHLPRADAAQPPRRPRLLHQLVELAGVLLPELSCGEGKNAAAAAAQRKAKNAPRSKGSKHTHDKELVAYICTYMHKRRRGKRSGLRDTSTYCCGKESNCGSPTNKTGAEKSGILSRKKASESTRAANRATNGRCGG